MPDIMIVNKTMAATHSGPIPNTYVYFIRIPVTRHWLGVQDTNDARALGRLAKSVREFHEHPELYAKDATAFNGAFGHPARWEMRHTGKTDQEFSAAYHDDSNDPIIAKGYDFVANNPPEPTYR